MIKIKSNSYNFGRIILRKKCTSQFFSQIFFDYFTIVTRRFVYVEWKFKFLLYTYKIKLFLIYRVIVLSLDHRRWISFRSILSWLSPTPFVSLQTSNIFILVFSFNYFTY